MSLCAADAFFFLTAALLVHWLLPRSAALQNVWLLACSYLFYASHSVTLLLLLVVVTAIDWLVGLGLGAPGGGAGRARRPLLALSLTVNLGLLAWFKYSGLLTGASLALPLGLSFYTLQKLGYVLDVYVGRRPPVRSPLLFATFVAFFPQITAGPISFADELVPQLERPRRLLPEMVASGAFAYLLGFLLKAFCADSLGPELVDPVFAAPAAYGALSCWLATGGYALQVFCDFAGYSLMAIGIGQLFGLELPTNFAFPFLSRSLPEFWRRWHITLNRWLFRFIFTPLVTGSGWFRGRVYTALMLVFLASGIWHGSSATFVMWGLLQGIGMVVHQAYDRRYRDWCKQDRRYVTWRRSAGYALAALLLTQVFFVVTMVPFRAASLDDTAVILRAMCGLGSGTDNVLHQLSMHGLLAILIPVLYHLLQLPWLASLRELLARTPAPLRGVAYGLLIVFLLVYVPPGSSTFIYRNF